ncbi:thymidylate synthase [Vibrio spartinae]|uniref:Thymidylate synthase 1 n=1 Tax=Vibrio spartinae TaxID=1918945 RepID=A0A1N6M3H7_9VIBR|nr:thymidylate synthase [Vibrio spartinae]SIO93965.1 Thymidylate synthase 1 [Vibrio spartinae]
MHAETYNGIDELLVKVSGILLTEAVPRRTRGMDCYELPEPIMIKINNPTSRLIKLKERRWPYHIGYAESLWIANGRNDLDFMTCYLPKLNDFSDDGYFIRGGYGPRIRKFNNEISDYSSNEIFEPELSSVDQLSYIIRCLSNEKSSRRAVIDLGDPNKDNFIGNNLKKTKDYPCTRTLQFIINSKNELDLYVHMRSNDFIWGMTGVNIFNFTFIQEYLSQIINVNIGSYYHMVNNLHYYGDYRERIVEMSKSKFDCDIYKYKRDICSFSEFNSKLKKLSIWERELRQNLNTKLIDLESDFMNDWQKVLYQYITKSSVEFVNPTINY